MRSVWLAVSLLFVSGCTDLVSTEVGAERVDPIELERDVSLGDVLAGCPAATVPVAWPNARAASVALTPRGGGCEVTLELTEVVVVDRARIEAQAESLGGFDETALVGVDVELVELTLEDGSARSLDAEVREASLSVDGQLLFEGVDAGRPEPRPRGSLGERTVADFRGALAEPRDVRADLSLHLLFADSARLPKVLAVRVVLQPILIVDVIRAAL